MSAPLSAIVRHVRSLATQVHNQSLTDAQLLECFAAERDEAAFALLVQRYGGLVLGIARRILHDSHAAEDVFQNTFLTLARRAGAIRKREALASWLYGTAVRLALRMRRSEARRSAREKQALQPQAEDVAEAAAWRELGAVVDEELQRLPEKYRAPLVLIYFAGQTQEEAARQLHCGKSALRGRLDRAKRALHDRLLRRGVSLSIGLLAAGIAQSTAASALPSELVQATVQQATRCIVAKSATWAVGLGGFSRAKMALAIGLLTAAAGWAVLQSGASKPAEAKPESSAAPPVQTVKKPRVDRFGDPLPEGAIARLGTMRFRHPNGTSLAFALDGKSIRTCGADRTIRTWDADSGRLLREQQLPPGPYTRVVVLSPDGRLLAYQDPPSETLYIWDVERHWLLHKLPLEQRAWYWPIFSPDCKTLVTHCLLDNGILQAWDVATGKGRTLGKLRWQARRFSFSADGTLMVKVGGESAFRFWDLTAGRERSRMTVPDHIMDGIVSPDGRTVAVWSWHNKEKDKGLEFRDAATGKPAKGWIAPDWKRIGSVRFAPDGKTVAISTSDGVSIWDPFGGKTLRTLPRGGVGENFAFSPDGKTLAAFGLVGPHNGNARGCVLYVWDLATGAPRDANRTEHGHLDEVDGVAFAPDGRTIASSCTVDRTVRLWDAASGKLLRTLPVKDILSFHTLTFTPDGKCLLAGTSPAVVRWDIASGREIGGYAVFGANKEDRHRLMVPHLTEDGRTLLALSQSLSRKGARYGLHAWDAATGERQRFVPFDANNFLTGYCRFSPDGRWLAFADGTVRDAATGQERMHLTIEEGKTLSFQGPIAFSRDGDFLADAVWRFIRLPNGQRADVVAVQIWELDTLTPVIRLDTGKSGATHLAFTPDGRRLIVAGKDGLKSCDLAAGTVAASRPAPGRFYGSFGASFASALAIAANSRTVATGQADTTLLLWDLSPSAAKQSPPSLTKAQLEGYWNDLAGTDAYRAFIAQLRLADVPSQALPMLRQRLRPIAAPSAEELRRLLAELDHELFPRREAANKRLLELGEWAYAALREELKRKPSLEMRRRIEGILAQPPLLRTPEARRQLRVIRVLEGISTAEARNVLEALAKGAPEARLTRKARATLDRMARRP